MSNILWNYEGKVVVITGAATGIGKGTALAFARAGADVCVCDFNEEDGKKTVEECSALGTHAAFYKVDVRNDEMILTAKEAILEEFGTVDILFSNAGISSKVMGPPLDAIPDSDWENTFEINTHGMIRVSRAFIPIMKEKRSGKIIFTSSIAMNQPMPATMPYGMSKIATSHFAQGLAQEMGPFNVNVNVICPGYVYTNIYADGTALKFKEKFGGALAQFETGEQIIRALASQSALKRPQTPQDIANAVLFLASDEASEITGQILNVDSGIIFRF